MLQIWDLGGQERFDFLKDEYFLGADVVALCFDLTRPASFDKLDHYLRETREVAGPIPVLLIGNKIDLEEDIGEMITASEINEWMRTHQITDFLKTSAKTGYNIEKAFRKLSILSLIDLKEKPRLGQFRKDGIFRFKIILVGAGGVGKTSITRRFAEGVFTEDYKLTIGVDFLTKDMNISEDMLPQDALHRIAKYREIQQEWIEAGKRWKEPELDEDFPKTSRLDTETELKDLSKAETEVAEDQFFAKESISDEILDEQPSPKVPPVPPGGRPGGRPGGGLPKPPKSPSPVEKPEPSRRKVKKKKAKSVVMKEKSSRPPIAQPMADLEKKHLEAGEKIAEAASTGVDDVKGDLADKPVESLEIPEEEEVMDELVAGDVREVATIKRKSTVYYKKQMNPFTLNELTVVLSNIKIYEKLKKRKIKAERTESDRTLEIKEISPYVQVEPYFPGCICVPAMIPLDARKDAATADFKITPLATGDISDATVRIYYEGKIIDEIKTPTKVVKQTMAKISGLLTGLMPLFGPLFDDKIGGYLSTAIPFWDSLGGIEEFFLLLSGISALFTSVFYMLKRPKDAEPVHSNFPDLDEILNEETSK